MSLAALSPLRRIASQALDLLLPPLCLSCDAPVAEHRTLCPACWGRMQFIAAPFCACCGAPFDVPAGEGALCGSCIGDAPAYAAARAPMLYDDASRRIILGFKHGDRTYPAAALAAWMHRAGTEFWADADCVVPVPLHRWRLLKRRYNQSALLANELGRMAGKPVLVDALLRQRATPVQGHLKRDERAANVKGAFTVNPFCRSRLAGKAVVLVDDVLTTGATVNESARVLCKAGARSVNVLTLARVKALL
ncbi:MAG: ComF family protein [Bdellovibrionales bacterium]